MSIIKAITISSLAFVILIIGCKKDDPKEPDDNTPCINTWYMDADQDGYGDSENFLVQCLQPEDYTSLGNDCNDSNNLINPDSQAVPVWYKDADQDGYGNEMDSLLACSQPEGYVSITGDCNDFNEDVNPDATEILGNGIDDDCDNNIDDTIECTSDGGPFFGNVVINSEEELLTFGSNCYSSIEGNLLINIADLTNSENQQSLSSLASIDSISGEFKISNCNNFISLHGLDSLQSVGEFVIVECENLTTLEGLEALTTIEQTIFLSANPNLENLSVLNSVTEFGSAFFLRLVNNLSLVNLDGLNNLTDLQTLKLEDNNGLTSLDGLNNVTSADEITLESNIDLSDFCSITALIVDGSFQNLTIIENAYNPTVNDFINGDCSE